MDLIDELHKVERSMGLGVLQGGPARVVTLRRTIDAPNAEVWSALTDPDHLAIWCAPVAGDLRAGGSYSLRGHATGQIQTCAMPRLLRLTWLYGARAQDAESSLLEVRLTPLADRTRVQIDHLAVLAFDSWRHYGPGAIGVGWDLALVSLVAYLAGLRFGDLDELRADSAMRDAIALSAELWGDVHRTDGANAADVAAGVAGTSEFYLPPLNA